MEYSPMLTFLLLLAAVFVIWFLATRPARREEAAKIDAMSTEDRAAYRNQKAAAQEAAHLEALHGALNLALVCPHCQARGGVHTRSISRKAGLSGGKATAAVLTGGVSLLATGLSRKERTTEAYCKHCGSIWHF